MIQIYKDDKQEVYIAKFFDQYLRTILVKTMKLSPTEYNFSLTVVLKKLQKQGFDIKNCKVISSSNIPILEYGKAPALKEPFNIFSQVFDLLTSYTEIEDEDEFIELVSQYYKEFEIPFYIEFLDKPMFGMDGVMATQNEKNEILIAFFVLDKGGDENGVD